MLRLWGRSDTLGISSSSYSRIGLQSLNLAFYVALVSVVC